MRRGWELGQAFGRLMRLRDGNFGMITALVAIPLVLSVGVALDYTNASSEREHLQALADSAALAGGGQYDGTNASVAISTAQSILKSYAEKLPAGTTYDVKLDGQSLSVTMDSASTNAFMGIVGRGTTDIGVVSTAISPMKPKKITFVPTKAQGWYYKKVSIIVVRPKSTAEEVVGTVTYQPTTQADGGQGTMVVSPQTTLELGDYAALILKMEIKNDGCGLNQKATVSNSKVTCSASNRNADRTYNLTLRTDNPDTTHYLFVDGVQLPQGVTSPLESILECGKTSNHAWEDGGGWARQDFFYTATSYCAPNGQFVRLTK